MEPFRNLTAVAVPIDEPNIDTNQLCPTRFSKTPRGPGHAKILFHYQRFNPDGSETDFILNRAPFRSARIIVGDRNWGCGSGREGAVYALYEFGIRCVIAASFAETHAANCARNGILTVVLPGEDVIEIRRQLHARPGASLVVKIDEQIVIDTVGRIHRFEMQPGRKKRLLLGLDDFSRTDEYRAQFEQFEQAYLARRGWLLRVREQLGGLRTPSGVADAPRKASEGGAESV